MVYPSGYSDRAKTDGIIWQMIPHRVAYADNIFVAEERQDVRPSTRRLRKQARARYIGACFASRMTMVSQESVGIILAATESNSRIVRVCSRSCHPR